MNQEALVYNLKKRLKVATELNTRYEEKIAQYQSRFDSLQSELVEKDLLIKSLLENQKVLEEVPKKKKKATPVQEVTEQEE